MTECHGDGREALGARWGSKGEYSWNEPGRENVTTETKPWTKQSLWKNKFMEKNSHAILALVLTVMDAGMAARQRAFNRGPAAHANPSRAIEAYTAAIQMSRLSARVQWHLARTGIACAPYSGWPLYFNLPFNIFSTQVRSHEQRPRTRASPAR